MLKYYRVPTGNNSIISKPGNSFCHIFYVFTCASYYKIATFNFKKGFSKFLAHKRFCFCSKCAIVSVYLPIVDAANSTFGEVFLLQSIAPKKRTNLSQWFKLHAVGAEAVD